MALRMWLSQPWREGISLASTRRPSSCARAAIWRIACCTARAFGRRLSNVKQLRLFAIVVGALFSQRSFGQARVVSAPSEPSLLNLTTAWARASTLGDLRDPRVSGDYLEL